MANPEQRAEKTTDGIEEKIVYINRTSKVVKGGRNFSFLVLIVAGDGEGLVNFGLGKAKEVPVAMRKANESARRDMKKIQLTNRTLQHTVVGRHGATTVWMKPASEGTGIIAGGTLRAVCEVMGIDNVLTKIVGSTNPLNVVRAAIKGLSAMVTPEAVAEKRGLTVKEMLGDQNGGKKSA